MAESVQQIPPADAITAPATMLGSRTLRRMLAAFTHRDFRVQWVGACTSSVGTWTQLTAQNWLILSLTGSAFFLGLDGFLQQLPIMLFTLIGGVLADRLDRRRTLIASQFMQMTTALVLAVLVYLDVVRIWHILVLSFMAGLAQALEVRLYQALIPALVEDKKIFPTRSPSIRSKSILRVLGPLVFGATITAFAKGIQRRPGMAACFLVNALSFLVVIYTLNILRAAHPYRHHAHATSCAAAYTSATTAAWPRSRCWRSRRRFWLRGAPVPVDFAQRVFHEGGHLAASRSPFERAGGRAPVIAWLGKFKRMGWPCWSRSSHEEIDRRVFPDAVMSGQKSCCFLSVPR